jgi:hypothetical protein
VFLSLSLQVIAQHPISNNMIKGTIVDSMTHLPVGFATVVLLDSNTSRPIHSVIARKDGSFEIEGIVGWWYVLEIASVGYLSISRRIASGDLAQKSDLDLGTIFMTKASKQLKDVFVIAGRPIVRQEIDRISYDVQADPESKSNDALEILRKVPLITVDGNDNIQLKGSNGFQIFVNGRPSALMANSPAEVLKAMPAATIQKIEVITVPPAKYDAEGILGIINIITLKKTDDGFNGSLFARYNNIFGERGSVTFNLKKAKLGLNILLGLGRQPTVTTQAGSQLENFAPPTILSQDGQNSNGGNFNNGQVRLSYELDSSNLLTAFLDFFNRQFSPSSYRYSQFFSPPDSLTQAYPLINIGTSRTSALDIGANYQLGFNRFKDELLTFSFQYSSSSNDQQNAVSSSDGFNYVGSTYNQQNTASAKEQTFQLDWVKPIRGVQMEAGAKAILRNNFSNFGDQNLDSATHQYTVDTALTNQFDYHQNVYSIYNSYQLKLNNWTIQAGLRLENTAITSLYNTEDSTYLDQHYLNLIPAISIQRSYAKRGSFTLGYTERIQRPGLQQLNPFIDRSNPEFITTGNPALRPVLNHVIELGYSAFAKVYLNVSVNYSFANNTIQNVTSLINDTVTLTTYANVGKNQSAGLNLSTNYPITSKLDFSLNAQLAHLWITGTYNGQFYQNDGTQGNANAFLKYNFDHDFSLNLSYGYFSGNIFLQGKSSDYEFTSINILKDFFNKRATLSLTLNNPLKKFDNYSAYTKTPDFEQSSYSRYYYRQFRLAVNYKFGHLNSELKTNHRGIKNEDVQGIKSSENQ